MEAAIIHARWKKLAALLCALTALLAILPTHFNRGPSAAAAVLQGPTTRLKAAGPVGDHGFPVWYKDSNGLSMGLCLDGNDPLCGFLPDDIPDSTQPISFPSNFPDEAFYMLASAQITLPGGGLATLVTGLEAAFAGGPAVPGDQIVFGRVRIRIDAPGAGTYKVTHPYGVDEFVIPEGGNRIINATEDIGIGAPGVFTGALNSRIDPLLRWDTGLVKGADGSSYLGDPDVLHKVVGSNLNTNFFRIDGPNIGGTGINTVTTNLFSLMGKLATNAGVSPLSVTYTRTDATGGYIDVFAVSQPEQSIQVTGSGLATTTLHGDADGHYFGRAAFSGSTPPATVKVSNVSDRPRTDVNVTVTDRVTVQKATYDSDLKKLTVQAGSSDSATPPTLTVQAYGPLTGASTEFDAVIPPAAVIVSSSKGGSDNIPVSITGAAFEPDTVVPQAGQDLVIQQGQKVILDGSNSLNATSYAWSQTVGTPVALTNQNTAVASFTAPSVATDLTFRLTVQGPGGPKYDDVIVKVMAVAAPVANAGAPQSVLQGSKVTLDGSQSTGVTGYSWSQTGGPIVALTGATTAKPTFTMPNTNDSLIFQLTVTGPGGSDYAVVQISPRPDVLTVDQAEYRRNGAEWRISGTASIVTTNTVTIYVVNGTTRTKLGTATVDALGVWSLRLGNSTVVPTTTSRLAVESTRGGILTGITIFIRN